MMNIRPFLLLLVFSLTMYGQDIKADSLFIQEKPFSYKALIIPTTLIVSGILSIKDKAERQEIVVANYKALNGKPQEGFLLDDIAQYTPTVSVLALNAIGLKGKNNFLDLSLILGTAYLITGVTVKTIKHNTNIQRPDATAFNAFPSGHTASAFVGAEMLYQEYKHKSIWYGVAGYVIATATGYSRVDNNRHWASDVLAGAGVGILGTKLAYWIHPVLRRVFFKEGKKRKSLVLPYLNTDSYGLAMSVSF